VSDLTNNQSYLGVKEDTYKPTHCTYLQKQFCTLLFTTADSHQQSHAIINFESMAVLQLCN